MKLGEHVDVLASELDEAGHGIGATDKRKVHVLDLLPGESAAVEIEHLSLHSDAAWGALAVRIGPDSEDRVAPACEAFGSCGGCVWQHLAYPAQLAQKTRRVEKLLPGLTVAACLPSPETIGYRNRGKYVVGFEDGQLYMGAYAPRGQHLVDTLACRTVEPAVATMAGSVHAALSARAELWPFMKYVVVRANAAGQTLVALVTTCACPRQLVAAAAADVQASGAETVLWIRNDLSSGTILTDDQEVLSGGGTLSESLCGVAIEIGASEFLQVNRGQAERLYSDVAELLCERGVDRAVDLYCGAGGFALALAQRGIATLGIERDERAVALARQAASRAGLTNLEFVAAAAESARLVDGTSAVVVDPPRKGLSEAVLAEILRLSPAHLVYVSCDPKSFARDADKLINGGYRAVKIQPLDMMPGTGQVELFTLFERR